MIILFYTPTIQFCKRLELRASIEVEEEEVDEEVTGESEEGAKEEIKVVLPQNNFYNI